ncbi:MAG: hypothetical protein CM15mP32_1280 [Flavobacteriaceae bacterium]|nr:MAG: hypothetical protein CM15mP32_1280 [Flavobacteriaceae bacterium]
MSFLSIKKICSLTWWGTPCYADNMQSVLQATPHTFYLSPSVNIFANRLFPARSKRPMISHLNTKRIYWNLFLSIFLKENNFMSKPIIPFIFVTKALRNW